MDFIKDFFECVLFSWLLLAAIGIIFFLPVFLIDYFF
jgi:hypothetical protein